MPKISQAMQRAIDKMALHGYHMEYRRVAATTPYLLCRAGQITPVHANVARAMIEAGYVKPGISGPVEIFTITSEGRALATPGAAQ